MSSHCKSKNPITHVWIVFSDLGANPDVSTLVIKIAAFLHLKSI